MMNLPPVAVFNTGSPIGLTVVRELGARGVPVHAFGANASALGLHSRHIVSANVTPKDDAEFGAALSKLLGEGGFAIPIGEADALRARRIETAGLAPGVRMLCATEAALKAVNDKTRTYAAAARVGVDTPLTWEIPGPDAAPPEALTYPCIAKWAHPHGVQARLKDAGLSLEKCAYLFSRADLDALIARYAPIGEWPLIQSYARGIGLGQMALMKDGAPVFRFQHQRLGEWPPTGGVSALCRALPLSSHEGLFERSIALLQELGWEGPAMVEYRHDPETGRSELMEINGRFWGSLPLASRAGVPFGWGVYAALGLGQI